MKPKHGALLIALILTSLATLVFILLPSSANLTVAYLFCLIGIALMEGGFLIANIRNVPASYALLGQTGKFLPVSLVVSVFVLIIEHIGIFTLPAVWHVAVQIVLLAVSAIRLVQIFSGAAYINEAETKVADKRNAWITLTDEANMLAARERDAENKAALKKVAETLHYQTAAELFKQIGDYKDASDKAAECYELGETIRKDAIYQSAVSHMAFNSDVSYDRAIQLLEMIPGWRDSYQLIAQCQQKKQEILRRAERYRQARIEADKNENRKRRLACLVVLLIIVYVVLSLALRSAS